MTLIKRNNGAPSVRSNFLSDFFNTERFPGDPFFTKDDGMPAVNVSESDNSYEIEVAAPGMKKEDFNVDVENGILTISGQSKSEKEEEDKNYTRREFSYNTFSRSFSLPENANEEAISAKYDNGVLRLTLAKKEPSPSAKKKSISIG